MDPQAMLPYGLALRAYAQGETEAELIIRRDDGVEDSMPVSLFFRPEPEFSPIERAALERCRGRVLDIGAGTGLHSLVMQSRGAAVTAIDVSPQAVDIMSARGVRDVHRADVFAFDGGPFDTLLMLGHGIGMVEDLPGLEHFLIRGRRLVAAGGRLLIHSLDVGQTDDPRHKAYHEASRRAGRYIGSVRLQFESRGTDGPYCGWLHVDPQTLAEHAERTGWTCETVLAEPGGEYLAELTPGRGAPPRSG